MDISINKVRNFARIAGLTTALVTTIGLAGASADFSGSGSNTDTGPNSINRNRTNYTRNIASSFTNDARADNRATVNGDTGDVNQHHNTTGGSIDTGSVEATGSFTNDLNSMSGASVADASSNDVTVSSDFNNSDTGPNSRNQNELNVNLRSRKTVTNTGHVTNTVTVNGNTGDINQHHNTTGGDITTGDVVADVSVSNSVNAGAAAAAMMGGSSVSVDGSGTNDHTGPSSENRNDTTVRVDDNTTVRNRADITNSFVVNGTTGGINQNNNTTGGDITTGGVTVSFTADNTAN